MEKKPCNSQDAEVRKGPWTVEEDMILMNYVVNHGEGVWNNIAKSAGLRRTGKSCRLRWLNYLKPDVRRGNITPEEQLLIMELHARWGNKWSRIASHLPGRTDNEIKNFWRTRIQKQLKQAESSSNQIVATAQDEGTSSACGAKEEDEPFSLLLSPPPPPPPTYHTSNPEADQAPPSMESDDSFWSMEDLLSNQFFNGD